MPVDERDQWQRPARFGPLSGGLPGRSEQERQIRLGAPFFARPQLHAHALAPVRKSLGSGAVTLGALLGRPVSTVGKVRRRLGHSRRPRVPRPPVVRDERAQPGALLHLDTKKLGRFWHVGKRITRDGIQRSPRAGWLHVAIDDHSRLAYAEVRPVTATATPWPSWTGRGPGSAPRASRCRR